MKKFNNQSYGSYVDRMNYGGAKFYRFALFPLMLLMLLLLPTRMVAQTAASSSKYIATYESSTQTLTFKKFVGETLPSNSVVVENGNRVAYINKNLGNATIKHIVFDKSFSTYTPTKTLYGFFKDLTKLETISGLEYLNTANVNNMSNMFYGCQNLSSLDLSKFNTEKVTDMSGMFYGCQNLSSLDLSYFNTANVRDMGEMFKNCSALTIIYASDNFKTDKVIIGSKMFDGCTNLKGYDSSKTNHKKANCGTDGYFTPVFDYAEFDNATGTLTFRRGVSKPEGAYDLNVGDNEPGWYAQRENIEKVVFDASFANARPMSCYSWFYKCTSLTEIEGIENLNTQNVENMRDMFASCIKLKSLDVSKFNTANVTKMSHMFEGCEELSSLDLSNFDTQNVKYMNQMFHNCNSLTSLDLSNFDTQNGKYMSQMFHNCNSLTSLDVSNFNTQKVMDMRQMFYNCNSLTSLDVSNFDTQNVIDMSDMFYGCQNLSSLDLSKFDTQKVTYMYKMFYGCSGLKTIYGSDKFVITKEKDGSNMFSGCTNLKGFIDYISNTDKDKDDNKYANYKTGYFTKLVGKNGEKKIGAAGEALTTENLILEDGKDFVAYEPFAAKNAFYIRVIPEGSKWGTLCLPFAIDQSKETECKFYRLTGIDNDNDCITLESCEEGIILAGTPVLFKMNENEQTLSISVQNADLVKEPVAGTDSDVNLVGSFTKIGGKDNQGLDKNDYIIGKDKFWRVSDLNDGNGVGIKPMRAYIHPATASQARAAMLSIGKGDGTTAIDNLNAISNDANAEYYDANGRRTYGLQKGLNIVKRGSKTYKIMVK